MVKKKLTVALVHDVLLEYGGSERVLEELCKMYPKAELYTFYFNNHNKELVTSFGNKKIHTSLLQTIPWLYKLGPLFSLFKPFALLFFLTLKMKEVDVVISSSHSYSSKSIQVPKPTVHISYIHTPPKYLYAEKNELAFIHVFPLKQLLYPLFFLMKFIDKKSAQRPNILVCSGTTVSKRIKRYYSRAAVVIPPPIMAISLKKMGNKYFVAHSRLVKQKNIQLAVKFCTKYGLPLVVIGDGYQLPYLKQIAGTSIFFVGRVTDEAVAKVYQKATALLYCSEGEDFGIVPIEAMSAGVPVIAYKDGGVTETVIEGTTGVFFTDLTVQSMRIALDKFKKKSWSHAACRAQAKKYSTELFRIRMQKLVEKLV